MRKKRRKRKKENERDKRRDLERISTTSEGTRKRGREKKKRN